MIVEDFDANSADHVSCLIAMNVRNALEDLHCEVEGLTDDVMKVLNQKTRRAIYEIVRLFVGDDYKPPDHDDDHFWTGMAYLVSMIPDYWEMPSSLERVDA